MTVNNGKSGWEDLLVDVYGQEYCVRMIYGIKNDNLSIVDVLGQKAVDEFIIMLNDEQYELLDELLDKTVPGCTDFTDMEKTIISMRYGLNGGAPRSIAEIANKVGLTEAQVPTHIRRIKNRVWIRQELIKLFLGPIGDLQSMVDEEIRKTFELKAEISQYSGVEINPTLETNAFKCDSRCELLKSLEAAKEKNRLLGAELAELEFVAEHCEGIDDVSLDEFTIQVRLSTRSYNALRGAELYSFGKIRKSNLIGIKNLGDDSRFEVISKVDAFAKRNEIGFKEADHNKLSVDYLGLSARAYHYLLNVGCETLGAVRTKINLDKYSWRDEKIIAEIKQVLKDFGA